MLRNRLHVFKMHVVTNFINLLKLLYLNPSFNFLTILTILNRLLNRLNVLKHTRLKGFIGFNDCLKAKYDVWFGLFN